VGTRHTATAPMNPNPCHLGCASVLVRLSLTVPCLTTNQRAPRPRFARACLRLRLPVGQCQLAGFCASRAFAATETGDAGRCA
jgi:hypothetical protein